MTDTYTDLFRSSAPAADNIPLPAAGEQLIVEMNSTGRFNFDFTPEAVTVSRQGDDLIFTSAEGGQIVFRDLFPFFFLLSLIIAFNTIF